MIILCKTLLPSDKVLAIPADIGKINKATPVIDGVIEVDVAPMITIESIDSNIVFRILKFLYFFFEFQFLSLEYVIVSLMLLIWLLKLFASFIFFPVFVVNHLVVVVQMGIIFLVFAAFI